MERKRKPLPAKHPIDRAVNRMLRALDKRLMCASGMPWYPNDAKRVNAIRKALLDINAVPYDTKEQTQKCVDAHQRIYAIVPDGYKVQHCLSTVLLEDLEQGR